DVGYLVTKVVAVDVDFGQNAWLSYKLHKPTDRALFEVGLQNGEIRTVRQVTDKDAVKQKLTVVVEDNGQPSRSATVNVNVVVADTFPEVLSEFTDFTYDKQYNDNLTFYLVLALAVVSFLFIMSIIAILSVKCYRWRRERMLYKSGANLPVIPYYPPLYADLGGTGTLQHMYNYEAYRTSDSRKSDLKCARPPSESIISVDSSGTQTIPTAQREKTTFKFDEVRYSIPEEMNKGSVVGNIVQDLGLDVKRLKSGRARIFTEDSREYIGLNVDKGTLIRHSYTAYVMENNSPGVSIFAVTATDRDSGNNARISYFLEDLSVNGVSASSYISVNAESGEILAIRSFDFEQTKEFNIRVKAQDGGNPP
ncbi:putative protocadherin beta-18, partial [Tachysurus ichikawai]